MNENENYDYNEKVKEASRIMRILREMIGLVNDVHRDDFNNHLDRMIKLLSDLDETIESGVDSVETRSKVTLLSQAIKYKAIDLFKHSMFSKIYDEVIDNECKESYCVDCKRSVYGEYQDCDINLERLGEYPKLNDKCGTKVKYDILEV